MTKCNSLNIHPITFQVFLEADLTYETFFYELFFGVMGTIHSMYIWNIPTLVSAYLNAAQDDKYKKLFSQLWIKTTWYLIYCDNHVEGVPKRNYDKQMPFHCLVLLFHI